jgi:hypothetical protein
VLFALVLAALQGPDRRRRARSAFTDAETSLRWSPKGAKVELAKRGDVLAGKFSLGPAGLAPIAVELARTPKAAHVDTLRIDLDRDGSFAASELLTCTAE